MRAGNVKKASSLFRARGVSMPPRCWYYCKLALCRCVESAPGTARFSGPGESAMDASVRKALTSLKALLDEGFITKAEFGTRRQVIIDQATAVQQVAAPQTSADSTGITGPARSVFDRLGEPHLTQKRGVFDRLGLPKPAGSIRKPGVHGEQTDLRAKLTGGIKKPGAIKKPGERDIRKPGYDTTKPRGPAACPW